MRAYDSPQGYRRGAQRALGLGSLGRGNTTARFREPGFRFTKPGSRFRQKALRINDVLPNERANKMAQRRTHELPVLRNFNVIQSLEKQRVSSNPERTDDGRSN